MQRAFLLAALSFLTAATAVAHPGHGDPATQESVAHYLTSPVHLLPAAGMMGLSAALTLFLLRRRNHRSVPSPSAVTLDSTATKNVKK